MSTGPEVLVRREGAVQVITINRPEARNAMTRAAGESIAAALDELDADDALAAGVLTGSGGTFCSGMDLKRFAEGELPAVPGRGLGGLTRARPAKPLLAAVEGHAVAGGFELVLACDLVVAGRGARFGLPEVKRGLVARGGGILRLARRVPEALAMEIVLTGESVGAERLAGMGLVNRVVDDGAAEGAAIEWASRIAENAPLALRAGKRILLAALDGTEDEAFESQAAISDPVFASEDAREGAVAFAEKRPPRWRGR
jgi:enoyl-CoA hydratase